MKVLIDLLLLAFSVFLVARLLPAIHIKHFGTAVIVAIVYSLVNFFLGWFFFLLSLPFIILTFGLFKVIVNAILLWITDKIVKDFRIDGFGWTIIAAILITAIDTILKWAIWRKFFI